MRITMLKDRNETRVNEPKLAVVDKLAQVVEWPYSWEHGVEHQDTAQATSIRVTAELQAKLFREGDVQRNRYTAELNAAANSPHAILAALTEACGQISELREVGKIGEPIVLEIRLQS
jgi:hypothetical protein